MTQDVSKPKLRWEGNKAYDEDELRYRLISTSKSHLAILYYRPEGCTRPPIRSCKKEAAKAACERHWQGGVT